MRRAYFAWVLVLLAGCGLVLDAAPPARDAGIDAPSMDAPIEPRPDVYVEPGVDAALDAFEPLLPDAADAGAPPDAVDDGGLPDPCGAAVDGEGCGDTPRRICVGARCVIAGCGDGFVEGDEACEPVSGGPACNSFTCQWQCNDDGQCETGTPCLVGSCVAHACVYEERMVSCTDAEGGPSTCRGGGCPLASCGNLELEPGEECDVRAGVPGCLGCRFTCHESSECDDGDGCNGAEACADVFDGGTIVGRWCRPTSGPTCTTSDPCSVSECISVDGSARCEERLIDADGDGFGADARCGADCDDMNPLRNPGSPEICNGLDDDCDDLPDEMTTTRVWCRDADGDTFGDVRDHLEACAQPAGYVANCEDCFDAGGAFAATARLVNPDQREYFAMPYVDDLGSSSFDYDCSGDSEKEFDQSVTCPGLIRLRCDSTRGWAGDVPECGEVGTFATCRSPLLGLLCTADSASRVQRCH